MAILTYQRELSALHHGQHTWQDIASLLGLKQEKSVRRYVTGERRPSEAMQTRIHLLYESLLRAHLYCDPLNPDRIRLIRRMYRDKKRRWQGESIPKLREILKVNYRSMNVNDSPDAECHINFSQAKAKPRDESSFLLDDEWATERPLLIYLIECVELMSRKDFTTLVMAVLTDAKQHKPSLYRQLKWVGEL